MQTQEILTMLNEDPPTCPMCDLSTDHEFLGVLGHRLYLLCGACGWKFSLVSKLAEVK